MDELWLADQGDGTYRNPILFCDYSDPDAIRVGDTYYMTASSFNYVPGLPILVSKDLVNWKLVNYAIKNIPCEHGVRVSHDAEHTVFPHVKTPGTVCPRCCSRPAVFVLAYMHNL